MTQTDMEQTGPEWEPNRGDVVCVAVVSAGSFVDWSSDNYIPEPAAWIPEDTFDTLQAIARRLQFPTLGGLNIHKQSRVSVAECAAMLAHWPVLQTAAAEDSTAPWVAERAAQIRGFLELCVSAHHEVELLVEGP